MNRNEWIWYWMVWASKNELRLRQIELSHIAIGDEFIEAVTEDRKEGEHPFVFESRMIRGRWDCDFIDNASKMIGEPIRGLVFLSYDERKESNELNGEFEAR